jgi:hypothetical protein
MTYLKENLTLERSGQEDHEFEASLGYKVRPLSQRNKTKKIKLYSMNSAAWITGSIICISTVIKYSAPLFQMAICVLTKYFLNGNIWIIFCFVFRLHVCVWEREEQREIDWGLNSRIFTLAKQVVYHLSHTSSWLCYLEMGSLELFAHAGYEL